MKLPCVHVSEEEMTGYAMSVGGVAAGQQHRSSISFTHLSLTVTWQERRMDANYSSDSASLLGAGHSKMAPDSRPASGDFGNMSCCVLISTKGRAQPSHCSLFESIWAA
jgi:hypothetical protein